jgi:hypothetical protein
MNPPPDRAAERFAALLAADQLDQHRLAPLIAIPIPERMLDKPRLPAIFVGK